MRYNKLIYKKAQFIVLVLTIGLMFSCSTTSKLPKGEILYVGIEDVNYYNKEDNEHFQTTKEEIEAALACTPNGALFGSSYYKTPFPIGLWIWNGFSDSNAKFSKWITKTFGKAPVLMSNVNPALRSSVAQSILRTHGYFNGVVNYKQIDTSNPKKAKVTYDLNLGHLYTLDSIEYVNFPEYAQHLVDSTKSERLINKGDAFDVSKLDMERIRISNLLRNNGCYYYQPGYASYLADTINVPGKVRLKLQMSDSLQQDVLKKWYIGKLDISIKRSMFEKTDQERKRKRYTLHYSGKRSPVRMGTIMNDIKLKPKQLYKYDDYIQTADNVNNLGLFSMTNITFTPRDSTKTCDTLDVAFTYVLDKPYNVYFETNLKGKTNGMLGPELILGVSRINAFRGGEKIDFNLHGSYEWQTRKSGGGTSTQINSYEYGGDLSFEVPRLWLPFLKRNRARYLSTTTVKASMNVINRAKFFRRHVVSGDLTYNIQTTSNSKHIITPLNFKYDYMNHTTEEFKELLEQSPYLQVAMMDQFIPQLSYTYIYTSPINYRNPIYWETTVSESANILSLGYLAAGKKWNDKFKTLFKNEYAQFFKIQTKFSKTWSVSNSSQIVAHVAAGYEKAFGNSYTIPYNEQFYVGGANSIRAFTVRSIGPGSYKINDSKYSFIDQTGEIMFQANIEYRMKLFGNLYGALFLDAGNVWTNDEDSYRDGAKFTFKKAFKELATGTGVGIRYDLEFFVIRLDWGIGLHLPYDTGKSGYYNIPSFKEGQSIHLAIGYPF